MGLTSSKRSGCCLQNDEAFDGPNRLEHDVRGCLLSRRSFDRQLQGFFVVRARSKESSLVVPCSASSPAVPGITIVSMGEFANLLVLHDIHLLPLPLLNGHFLRLF
jgi:hypothetical protein